MPNFLLEETLRSLKEIREAHEEKQKRVESILAFAGSWSDMSSGEFDDMMGEMKRTRDNLFNREIEF